MIDSSPQAIFEGEVIDRAVRAVTVNIARAGALPSQVAYDLLNETLEPSLVRQDHIIMSRMLGVNEEVVGAGIGGMKIGGDVDEAFLLFPDPMGATGSSLATAIETYKTKVPGKPRRIVNIHLIVTPEYLRTMTKAHPDVLVYAIRARPRPLRRPTCSPPSRARAGTRSAASTTTSTSSPAAAASGRS